MTARSNKGLTGYLAGEAAEAQVERDYVDRGYPIVARRWRGAAGEIDLIARDGEGLIFIEVKKSRSFDAAAARLSARQMQRIYATAEEYLATQPKGALTEARFDVALVDAQGQMRIIENAFGAG